MVKTKKKKKFSWNIIFSIILVLLIIGALGLMYFGFKEDGFFRSSQQVLIINQAKEASPGSSSGDDIFDNCIDVCNEGVDDQTWDNGYDLKSKPLQANCKSSEHKILYGYEDQDPLLICCCYDETDSGDEDTGDDFELGCNDNDFTQTNFDDSIMFPGNCIDDLGQHNDECTSDGLLKEWSCPESGSTADTCSATYINCKSYLGSDAVCSNGRCLSQPECTQNYDCYVIHGEGWVCRNNICLEVTGVNCNQIVQDEGYQMGIWDPLGTYSQSCYEFCVYNCANGCSSHSTGGTWGLCCGYSCS